MNSLPVEILSQISEYLSTEDVIYLALRVCKRLISLLTSERGVRTLRVLQWKPREISDPKCNFPLCAFPHSALFFSGLEHLELWSPCHYNLEHPQALIWPRRLRTLKIPSSLMWSLVSGYSVLPTNPNLRPSRICDILPSLEELQLLRGPFFPKQLLPGAIASCLDSLPSSVGILGVDSMLDDENHAKHLESALLVEKASKQENSARWQSWLYDGVPSATSPISWSYEQWINLDYGVLSPKLNVTALTLDSMSETLPLSSFPFLSCLVVYKAAFSAELLAALPNTLTRLEVGSNTDPTAGRFANALYNAPTVPYDLLSSLPRQLLHLSWADNRRHSLKFAEYPRGLQTLRFNVQTPPSRSIPLSDLPSTLTELSLAPLSFDWTCEHLEHISTNLTQLTSLKLNAHRISQPDAFLLLPHSLRTLQIEYFPELEQEVLEFMPPGLTALKISRSQWRWRPWTDHMFKLLPRQLLYFSYFGTWTLTGALVPPETVVQVTEQVLIGAVLNALPPPMRARIQHEACLLNDDLAATLTLVTGKPPSITLNELPNSVTSFALGQASFPLDQLEKQPHRHMVVLEDCKIPLESILKCAKDARFETLHLGLALHLTPSSFLRLSQNLVELCMPLTRIASKTKFGVLLPETLKKVTVCSVDLPTLKGSFVESNIAVLNIVDATRMHPSHFAALPKELTHFTIGRAVPCDLACASYACSDHSNQISASDRNAWELLPVKLTMPFPASLTFLDISANFGLTVAQLSKLTPSYPSSKSSNLPPKNEPHGTGSKTGKSKTRKKSKFVPDEDDSPSEKVSAGLKTLNLAFVEVAIPHLRFPSSDDGSTSVVLNLPQMIEPLVRNSLPRGLKLSTREWRLKLTDHDVLAISEENVTELSVLDCHHPNVTNYFLGALPSTLTKLCMPHQLGFTSEGIKSLPSGLVHLQIVAKSIKPHTLERLPTTLEYLHLVGPSGPHGESLRMATSHGALKTLLLDKPSSLRSHFLSPSSLPWNSLTHLRLGKCELLTYNDISLLIPQTLQNLELFGIETTVLNQLMAPDTTFRTSKQLGTTLSSSEYEENPEH